MESNPRVSNRFPLIDLWRCCACLLVYFHHCGVNLTLPGIPILGFSGVHMFFLLSGYLIYGPFVRAIQAGEAVPNLFIFYRRRMLRICPAYTVTLVGCALVRYMLNLHPPGLLSLATHFFLVANYLPAKEFFSLNGVFWSLAVEMQF